MSTNDESPFSMFSSEAKKNKKTPVEKVSIPEPTLYQWMRAGKIEARYDRSVSKKGVLLLKAGEQEIKQLIELKNKPQRWWASQDSCID